MSKFLLGSTAKGSISHVIALTYLISYHQVVEMITVSVMCNVPQVDIEITSPINDICIRKCTVCQHVKSMKRVLIFELPSTSVNINLILMSDNVSLCYHR